jgi:hypothetical protein
MTLTRSPACCARAMANSPTTGTCSGSKGRFSTTAPASVILAVIRACTSASPEACAATRARRKAIASLSSAPVAIGPSPWRSIGCASVIDDPDARYIHGAQIVHNLTTRRFLC